MPRPPLPDLEERILDAAEQLWSEGGDDALNMRAVAQRARTHTPRIYSRFSDREALLRALRSRALERLRLRLNGATSLRDGLARYLDFAADAPFDYRLLFGPDFCRRTSPQQGFQPLDVLEFQLAARHGGAPATYRNAALSIWALLHGTAMLEHELRTPERELFRTACLDACERIVASAARS